VFLLEEEMKMSAKTILIVDDSPTEMMLMHNALQGKGYTLLTAIDGEQALQMVMLQKPDLVLLDVILPKKNGFQVCRQLKTTPETKGTKVIMITSKTQDSDRFWGLKQGADEYLTKPCSQEELLRSVARFV
jgi:DNA-binding response OmpR family regulator